MIDEKKVILVVDDIESIRMAIKDYFSAEYRVIEADNGATAIEIINNNPIDLLITDIRMPVMGGLELIRNLRKTHPDIPFALMTAYNVDDYIHYARRERIWNIIPKTTFLDLRFVGVMVRKLLEREIFGIAHYFPRIRPVDCELDADGIPIIPGGKLEEGVEYRCIINGITQNNRLNDVLSDLLIQAGAPHNIRQVIEEITSNAIVRAPAPDSDRQAAKNPAIKTITDSQVIRTGVGIIEGHVFISVMDYHGTLDRNEILYRLERQLTIDTKTGLPQGVSDLHGRGLYISREHTDQLIFNIEPGVKTEVIAIVGIETDTHNRAISIYQTEEPSIDDSDSI